MVLPLVHPHEGLLGQVLGLKRIPGEEIEGAEHRFVVRREYLFEDRRRIDLGCELVDPALSITSYTPRGGRLLRVEAPDLLALRRGGPTLVPGDANPN